MEQTNEATNTDTTNSTGAGNVAGATETATNTAGTNTGTATTATGEAQKIWPDDWRAKIAGTDDKALKRLERFNTPADVFTSYRAIEQRLSSGELKSVTPFPEKGTPEDQNKWRTENGIPEAPEKYQIDLGQGVVLGGADKPIVDEFLKFAHGKNLPNTAANVAVQWYMDFAEKQAQARHDADLEIKQKFEDSMRAEWGNDYRVNMNGISSILDMGPEGIKERFLNARMADGTPLGSDPDTLKFLSSLARSINPVTTIVPNAGANMQKSVEDELRTWQGKMGDKSSDYWKGPNAESNQQRYRELLEYRERNKGKAA